MNTLCSFFNSIPNWIIAIGTSFTAHVAFVALIVSIIEYYTHKNRNKASVLAKYNERYNSDPNIQKVVKYLLWKIDVGTSDVTEEESTKAIDETLYGAKSEKELMPTKNQVELFMRFFEEIQTSIDADYIEKKDAEELFSYYAKHLKDNIGNLYPTGDSVEDWRRFNKFVEQK